MSVPAKSVWSRLDRVAAFLAWGPVDVVLALALAFVMGAAAGMLLTRWVR
jgi:hypothetical protein